MFSEDCAYGNCVDCTSVDLEGLGDVESVSFYSWIQGEMYCSKQLKELPGIEVKGCVCYIFANLFLGVNESTCQIQKNVFYFTSKPLFVLEKIKF